jgi:hypothetical protein
MGFTNALPHIPIASITFHTRHGDFEKWAHSSLHDDELSEAFATIRRSGIQGEALRRTLMTTASRRLQHRQESGPFSPSP